MEVGSLDDKVFIHGITSRTSLCRHLTCLSVALQELIVGLPLSCRLLILLFLFSVILAARILRLFDLIFFTSQAYECTLADLVKLIDVGVPLPVLVN